MFIKNKYGELRSGWMLAMSLLLVYLIQIPISIIAFIVLIQTGEITDPDALSDALMHIMASPIYNSIVYPLMICLILLLFWLNYKRPFRQIGFYPDGWIKQLLLGGLFGIVLVTLITVILLVSGAGRIDSVDFSGLTNGLFWAGFLLFLYIGFFEEILTRGVMMTALKTTRDKWVIILVPSAIFGLMHIFNDNVTVFSLINLMLIGVLLSYLFIKTGRLWAPIGMHITWNFFMGNVFGIPVSGMSFFSIISIQFTGPSWLTGSAFGLEGGLLCTIAAILGLLFTHYCIKQTDCFWRIDSDMPLTRGLTVAGAQSVTDASAESNTSADE